MDSVWLRTSLPVYIMKYSPDDSQTSHVNRSQHESTPLIGASEGKRKAVWQQWFMKHPNPPNESFRDRSPGTHHSNPTGMTYLSAH
jgi:hypothetical protein